MNYPKVSVITTCKGRLFQLKEGLPTWPLDTFHEVIVVDYDCPDGTSKWVASLHHPKIRAVRVPNKPLFHLSHARNVGARHATGDYFMFIDADTSWLAANCLVAMCPKVPVVLCLPGRESTGNLVVSRELFYKVEGYHEGLTGYGWEDWEFIEQCGCRIDLHGVIKDMPHDKELRMTHYADDHFKTSDARNRENRKKLPRHPADKGWGHVDG